MKKIVLLSLLSLFIVNKVFPAWAITGTQNVCSNISGTTKTYTYTITGFPQGSTNHDFTMPTTVGGVCIQRNGDTFVMAWDSDCSPASTQIQINSIYWYENSQPKSYVGPLTFNVNVARLGALSTGAWNVGPYACNTNSITYSIPAVCGASNYSWVIPPGWSPSGPLSGANVTSITVTPTATTGGTISVTAINSNNGCTNLTRTISATISRPVQAPVFSTTQKTYCSVASAQININSVPNASSYSWTYPSGWTGPATTITPYTTVNFNGVEQNAKITCTTNASCGGSSTATEFQMAYAGALPTDAGITYTVAITGSAGLNKKIVTVTISSCFWQIAQSTPVGGGSFQTVYLANNYTSGPTGTTTNLTMKNGDRVLVSVHNENACGSSVGTGVGYELVNNNLQRLDNVERPIITSVNETNGLDEVFKIFPNPASDIVNLNLGTEKVNYNISVYDVVGKKVIDTFRVNDNKSQINVSDLQNGIYFIQIEENNKIIRKEKMVISH